MKFNLKQPTNEESNIEWTSWSDKIKKVGDVFTIALSKLIFKDEPPRFFVIDEENQVGISAYCTNHPDSKFQNATPHGVRLVNALGRHFNLEGEVDVADLLEAVSGAEGLTVQVEKTEKGVLWSIA